MAAPNNFRRFLLQTDVEHAGGSLSLGTPRDSSEDTQEDIDYSTAETGLPDHVVIGIVAAVLWIFILAGIFIGIKIRNRCIVRSDMLVVPVLEDVGNAKNKSLSKREEAAFLDICSDFPERLPAEDKKCAFSCST